MQNTVAYQLSWGTIARRSLRWHWRLHAATVIALAVAVATLAGAIIIGWSLQKSLAARLLSRLDGVNDVLALSAPATAGLGERLGGTSALQLPGVAVNEEAGQGAAVPVRIWAISQPGPGQWHMPEMAAGEVVINTALARDCGVRVGEWISLTADTSPLRPEMGLFTFRLPGELRQTLRFRIRAIAESGTWADFTLGQSQSTPRNAFVAMNAIAGAGPNRILDVSASVNTDTVKLADLGLRIRTADGMRLLQSRAVAFTDRQLAQIAPGGRTLAVHIAQSIRSKTGAASYGVVASDSAGQLASDAVVLNDEVAKQLGAKVGDQVNLDMILARPDGSSGVQPLTLKVAGIDPIGAELFVSEVTTEIAGMTSAQRLNDWHAPFPVDMTKVTPADEEYWEKHRATPKAIIADSVMQQLWDASGFEGGRAATSIVLQGSISPEQTAAAAIAADPQWKPLDLRRQALAAGQGSSDFTGLFVAMSSFMVVGAILAAIGIARTALENRLTELGLAEALGLDRSQWQRWLMLEQVVVAVPASLLGIALGVLYAATMLRLFGNLSAGVWEMPPILLDVRWPVVPAGLIMAVVALAASWWQIRRELRRPVRELLGSVQEVSTYRSRRHPGRWRIVASLLAACAAVALARAGSLNVGAAYFLAATGMLVAAWEVFTRIGGGRAVAKPSRMSLVIHTALAQPRRMMLTFAIFAVATLVLTSVALYRTGAVGTDLVDKHGAAGGFALRLTVPFQNRIDLSTAQGLQRAGLEGSLPASVHLYGLAMSGGTEGGCLNLARPAEMQVLGVSQSFVDRDAFEVRSDQPAGNPWALLDKAGSPVPVFGDEETMQWIEYHQLGDEFDTPIAGRPTRVRLAGLVRGGLFSGQLLMSEANFRRLLPEQRGYRSYLIESSPADLPALRDSLKPLLQDGALLESVDRIIANVASVQRLYMTMFLVLGSLGLVLGGAGVMSVVVRDAAQRRGELALMQATGLANRRIAGVFSLGHLLPVVAGLAAGCISACTGYLATGLPMQVMTAMAIPAGLAVLVGVIVYLLARIVQPRQLSLALRSEG